MKYERNAYAKINLGLDVTGVLPNGYHLVKMIMQTVGIYDQYNFEQQRLEKASNIYLPKGKSLDTLIDLINTEA